MTSGNGSEVPHWPATEEPASNVDRTLLAVELLSLEPMTVDALATRLVAHPRTISRLMDSLVRRGWVLRDNSGTPPTFRLTALLAGFATGALSQQGTLERARVVVTRLRDTVGESAHYTIPVKGTAVHVVDETGRFPHSIASQLGFPMPLHATAVGKVFGAHLPGELEIFLLGRMTSYTPQTICDVGRLSSHYEEVRAQGYATDDEETTGGIRCVAAPVFDRTGRVIAAVGVVGPSSRITRHDFPRLGRVLREAASEICSSDGGRFASTFDGEVIERVPARRD